MSIMIEFTGTLCVFIEHCDHEDGEGEPSTAHAAHANIDGLLQSPSPRLSVGHSECMPAGMIGLSGRAVPGTVCLGLCLVAFWAGRFHQQAFQLPEVQPKAVVQLTGSGIYKSRQLHDSGQALETLVERPGVGPPADPLEAADLERWMLEQSGLLKIRPPVPSGDTGDDFYHAIPFQILSWFPRIVVYPAFADKARCEAVIKLAKGFMNPSGLAYKPGESGDSSQQTRTSKGTFVGPGQDSTGTLDWIEERIAAITLIPRSDGESFNVLEYNNGQHYDSHMDSFDPKDFGPQPSQRIATVLVYLSDVDSGGETVFKREGVDGDKRPILDWRKCDDGSLKYVPRQGDAVLFFTVDPNQEINPRALHGGCPVKNGTKWVMTKWLRSKFKMPKPVT